MSDNQTGQHPPPTESPTAPASKYRWLVCALLFFGTALNYIDRQVIGVLKPELSATLGWSEIDFANLVFAFQFAYSIGYVIAGPIIDRVGVRIGYGVAVGVWSLAGMAHGLVRSIAGFFGARFVLGFAEGANFPAAVKAIGDWFPPNERAFATGIFNAGANIGALITPVLVPLVTKYWGWQAAFYVTGGLGLLWLIAWIPIYRDPVKRAQLGKAIAGNAPAKSPARIPWLQLLRHRQTWMFAAGMFIVAPVWWFYLFWTPGFLSKLHHLTLLELSAPLFVIYLMSTIGSVGGGWLSSHLLRRGWSLNAARKTAMLVCALFSLPVIGAAHTANLWLAVALIGVATASHQGFATNLFTLPSDLVPREVVGAVVGIGGLASGIGGMLGAKFVGYILEWTGSYTVLFAIASVAYCAALLIMHAINPRMERM